MRQRLIRSAHNAEPNVPISQFHEARDDGVKRSFAARKYIRVRGIEPETDRAIMQQHAALRHQDTAAEIGQRAI